MLEHERDRRVPRALAGLLLAGVMGCKATGEVLTDIGDAVDRGAQEVVAAAANVAGPRNLPPPQANEEEAATRARKAYDAGNLAYRTSDYIVAVERFLESFAAAEEIEDPELKAQVQSTLYYNLGAAQLYAYDIDGDRTRLVKSKSLLQKYLDSGAAEAAEDREQAMALMAEADAKLAEADAK